MPKSLRNKIKHLAYKGELNERERDRILNALDREVKWIPVSERLPEEQITIGEYVFSKNVLGTEGFTIRKAYYNYTTKEWFDGNEEMEWTGITHWMPLPEPFQLPTMMCKED